MESVLYGDLERLKRELENVYSTSVALGLPTDLSDRTLIREKLNKIHDALGERWAKDKAA